MPVLNGALLAEAGDKLFGVQECYISVCKEKDSLEERLGSTTDEALTREREMKEQSSTALDALTRQLEDQHQASVHQLQAHWLSEQEAELQQQVASRLASAKAAWEEQQQQQQREEPRAGSPEEAGTVEGWSQTEDAAAGPPGAAFTAEELESRLGAQRQALQAEAGRERERAVKEARRRLQTELQKRHLEDLATQVEGAVSRAYGRWLEDLTLLPEYKANLQEEKDQWEEILKQKAAQTELLQGQLEHLKGEQAALLRAELAAARAAWTRDKEQEIASLLAPWREQEQRRLALALQRAAEEWQLQKKELLARCEAGLQQALGEREARWRGQLAEGQQAQRRQAREGLLAELDASLAELRKQPHGGTVKPWAGETGGTESDAARDTVAQIIASSYRDLTAKALGQAKKEWDKISEEKLSCALRDAQEQHQREIGQIQSSASLLPQEARCGGWCAEALRRLQTKNQELQRHLEKACRQLQHTVRDNKATVQRLKEEQESSLQHAQEDHRQQLEDVTRTLKDASGVCGRQADLQPGLDEMKQQYLSAVDKIRGDMLRYLQESKERAAQLIRDEVTRERQDTARRMRRYYMSCLQELLQHGEQTSGAEQKIMSAAGKLLAMAKVLETPVKKKAPLKDHALPASGSSGRPPSRRAGSSPWSSSPGLPLPGLGLEEGAREGDPPPRADPQGRVPARNKKPGKAPVERGPAPGRGRDAGPHASRPHTAYPGSASPPGFLPPSLSNGLRDLYLQGAGSPGGTGGPAGPELRGQRSVIRETPVRDEGESDWSAAGSSEGGRVEAGGRLARDGRQGEDSGLQGEEFGRLAPDASDLTVYNEFAKRPLSVPSAKRTCREPTPGSEVPGGGQPGKAVFSALRQCQQDSGFHSPFSQHQ
ncbi:unnamed protein product [Boreogadus saida]